MLLYPISGWPTSDTYFEFWCAWLDYPASNQSDRVMFNNMLSIGVLVWNHPSTLMAYDKIPIMYSHCLWVYVCYNCVCHNHNLDPSYKKEDAGKGFGENDEAARPRCNQL